MDIVSRENRVIAAFITAAVALLFVANRIDDPPTWVGAAIMIGVGVIAPQVVNGYLDRRDG